MPNSKKSNITQNKVERVETISGANVVSLTPFSSEYSGTYSASELARKTEIPQQSISRYLNEMAEKNLVNYKREGKNKLFYFNLSRPISRIMFNLIENEKSLQFLLKNKEISVIIEEILKNCESIIIFGSYASGTFNEKSDLDIVLLGKVDKEKIKKVKRNLGLEIVEHYVSYKEFEEILLSNNPLSIEILNNHIIFGDLSRIVNIFLKKSEK